MKIFIYILTILFLTAPITKATTYTGEVTKIDEGSNQVIDAQTKRGVEFAKISVPQKNISTYTDANGNFRLPNIQITEDMIIDVKKEGYRPFSLTINRGGTLGDTPLKIEIARSEAADISLDTQIIHLGDNTFSKNSANASDFKLKSIGPYYSKDFIMTKNAKNSTNYLVIGSIVGLDTKMAHFLGQNKIKSGAFSTPANVYFNGNKIGELNINGDNERIKIPSQLILADTTNQITIRTGENTVIKNRIDYDDVEIMNLSILSE